MRAETNPTRYIGFSSNQETHNVQPPLSHPPPRPTVGVLWVLALHRTTERISRNSRLSFADDDHDDDKLNSIICSTPLLLLLLSYIDGMLKRIYRRNDEQSLSMPLCGSGYAHMDIYIYIYCTSIERMCELVSAGCVCCFLCCVFPPQSVVFRTVCCKF